MMIKKNYLLLILTSILFSSCSSTKFAYNNADWYLLDKIEDYFNLSNVQQEKLGEEIHAFLLWHRRSELPEYISFLSTVSKEYIDGLSAVELSAIQQHLHQARNRIIERVIPPASNFLSTVTPVQINNYDRVVRKRFNEKKKMLELTDEQHAEESFNELFDILQRWFGDFTESQQSDIRSISDSLPDDRTVKISRNEKYHQQLITLLNKQPASREIAQFLRIMFFTPLSGDAAQAEIRAKSKARWQAALLKIDKLISHKQRQHAITRMMNYRDDFLALSQQPVNLFQASSADQER